MATVLTSSGWMTNFIYEQDLTSYYMNNMLTGVFRPGIYNANIALVIDNSENVYLSIKKGTTFLFSNSYFKIDGEYRRNFSGIDYNFNQAAADKSENIVLIKCVAQSDITQKIAEVSDLKAFCTNGTDSVPVFLFSYMQYKKQSSIEGEGSIVPKFRLATRNIKSGLTSDEFLYKTSLKYYNHDGVLIESTDTSEEWLIPDGCSAYDVGSRSLLDFSFLMAGVIYSSDITSNNFKQTLSFTGRGLPEYRHQMINNNNDLDSDIVFEYSHAPYLSKFYVDMTDVLISGDLVNKRICKQKSSVNVSYDPNYIDTGWEYPYLKNKQDESVSDNCISNGPSGITDSDRSKITSSDNVIIDFYYGYTDCETVENYSVNSLLTNNDITFGNSYIRVVESISTPAILKYFTYQSSFWTSKASAYVVPLDISMWNINRLSSLISNVNVCHKIFDYYRSNNSYAEATHVGTEMIPIAISFKLTSTNIANYPYQAKNGNPIFFDNEIDSALLLNPSNVLSYFDLKNKKCHGSSITPYFANVFNHIPIK